MSTIFLFPGQGSQSVGMGAELFEQFPDYVSTADDILGYSIRRLCLEDPDSKLNSTQYTQPALFAVEALTWLSRSESGSEAAPEYLVGHSLGEYAALFAAGVFDFETGLRLVQKRGELMGKAEGGGMAAVIGLDADSVRKLLESPDAEGVDVANYNSPSQIILSGPKEELESLQSTFEEGGARRYLPLKVSAAFHSRYMEDAGKKFADFLQGVDFGQTSMPVVSNVTARPYEKDAVRENLAKQITSPVRWQESVEYILDTADDPEFEELGPGNVLTRLVQQIQKAR